MARVYRKKPVTVEAVQWTGENLAEMCEFIDSEVFEIIPRVGLVIHTLEGDHHASPGDYIIKGVNGEFYPCKPDIFAKTYESATLTPLNEPLTLDELLTMDGEPVYVVFRPDSSGERSQSWALVNVDEKYGEVYLVDSIPGASCYYDEVWADLEGIYRRPPEGEEDT